MRTSVVIAAIGAAAVLGGVVACEPREARTAENDRSVELARRLELLEAQLATMQRVQEVDGEALNAVRINVTNTRWWCTDIHCGRSKELCDKVSGPCSAQRTAFCPLRDVGRTDAALPCFKTEEWCTKRVDNDGRDYGLCIGVE